MTSRPIPIESGWRPARAPKSDKPGRAGASAGASARAGTSGSLKRLFLLRQAKSMRPDVALAFDRLAAAARHEGGLQPGAEGAAPYVFGGACSMPSLKRPSSFWPVASGRRSIPRLKRGRRQRANRCASPWLKRPRRWRRQRRRCMPSAKPGSVCSGVAGGSFDAVIALVLSSCRAADRSEGTVSIGCVRVPRRRATRIPAVLWPPAPSIRTSMPE